MVYRDEPEQVTMYMQDPKTGAVYATDQRRAYLDAKRTIKQHRVKR